jgi:hypothetical protein
LKADTFHLHNTSLLEFLSMVVALPMGYEHPRLDNQGIIVGFRLVCPNAEF